MRELIVVTLEELEEIIDSCLSRYLPKMIEPAKQLEERLFYYRGVLKISSIKRPFNHTSLFSTFGLRYPYYIVCLSGSIYLSLIN